MIAEKMASPVMLFPVAMLGVIEPGVTDEGSNETRPAERLLALLTALCLVWRQMSRILP